MVLSQSLFSWIHLSYFRCLSSRLRAHRESQSLFSWIHLSYKEKRGRKNGRICKVSILIFLDSSFLWKEKNKMKKEKELFCLNPYFPGFIFLIKNNILIIGFVARGLNPYFPGFIFLIDPKSNPQIFYHILYTTYHHILILVFPSLSTSLLSIF